MKLFYFLFSLFISNIINAQIAGGGIGNTNKFPLNIQTPNVATLGVYGQIPVGHFTGLPEIKIPLFSEDLIDISLLYRASGIKPEEHSGWVGTGWALNAGGVITRIVNGGIDEFKARTVTSDPTYYSYYSHYNKLSGDNWDKDEFLKHYSATAPIGLGAPIPYPDEFVFNFGNFSGSFYYNHLGKWSVKSTDGTTLKIEEFTKEFDLEEDVPESGSSGYNRLRTKSYYLPRIFYGFNITAPDGTKYSFGQTKESIEFSYLFDNERIDRSSNYIATSWYLTKIKKKNGEETNFEYERDRKAVFKQSVHTNIGYYDLKEKGIYKKEPIQKTSILGQEMLFLSYLKSIKSSNFHILFITSTSNELEYPFNISAESPSILLKWQQDHFLGSEVYKKILHWRKLDEIKINGNSNVFIKNYTFKYLENPNSRLFLTNIEEFGYKMNHKKYSFEYNTIKLPEYNSTQVDHWGYYNGRNFFKDVKPKGGNNFYEKEQIKDYFRYRDPDPLLMQAGILTRITYPTGGTTEFQYEPHDYSMIVEKSLPSFTIKNVSNSICGGLRIKKIISNSANHEALPLVKEYFYVKDYKNKDFTSSGVISGYPNYLDENEYGWFWSSYSIEPMAFINGSYIGYSKVIEKYSDGKFVEYSYSNQDNLLYIDRCPNGIIAPNKDDWKKLPFNSKSIERGKLLCEKYYDKTYKLVKEVNNTYTILNKNEASTVRAICPNSHFYEIIINKNVESGYRDFIYTIISHIVSAFEINTYDYLLTKQEEVDYSEAGEIKNQKYITYNGDKLVSSITSKNSKGVETRVDYLYPRDIIIYNGGGELPFMKELVSLHCLSDPILIITYNNKKVVKADLFSYNKYGNLILPSIKYSIKNRQLPLNSLGNIDLSKMDIDFIWKDYDRYGNVLEQQSSTAIKESYQWGYNGQYPVAKIINAGANNREINYNYQYDYRRKTMNCNLNVFPGEQQFTFSNERYGDVKITLPGYIGEDWFCTYNFGNNQYNGGLLSMRGSNPPNPEEQPWKTYKYSVYDTYSRVHSGIPEGTYTLRVYPESRNANPGSSSGHLNIEYTEKYISKIDTIISGKNSWYYQGFEESPYTNTGYYFAGKGCYEGDYKIPDLNLSSGKKYEVNYHYLEGKEWKNKTVAYSTGMILSDGSAIDEVRLYPTDAQMSTYTYASGIGITSETDANNKTIFYEYDSFGRLKLIKDEYGNIIKFICYNYAGQQINCSEPLTKYYNVEKSRRFVKNDCRQGAGEDTLYVVPANKYSSVYSQADADRQALEDIQSQGQKFANINCKCVEGSQLVFKFNGPYIASYNPSGSEPSKGVAYITITDDKGVIVKDITVNKTMTDSIIVIRLPGIKPEEYKSYMSKLKLRDRGLLYLGYEQQVTGTYKIKIGCPKQPPSYDPYSAVRLLCRINPGNLLWDTDRGESTNSSKFFETNYIIFKPNVSYIIDVK